MKLTENDIQEGNAIKCMNCGFITQRIQWTHLKYKCSVQMTPKEYVEKHNTTTVAPNLAKNTAVTYEKFIKKYGLDIGSEKWNSYRQKQAYSNSFEYKKEKYNWDLDKYNVFNKSRSVTLNNLISRHGIDEANTIWDEYKSRQAYTCSLEYFIEKYGKNDGEMRFYSWRKNFATPRSGGVSKIEQDFANTITQYIPNLVSQYQIEHNKDGRYGYFYDLGKKDYVIEFNGDYWHCNPRIYAADALRRGTIARDIWNKDNIKRDFAINAGYKIIIVWEHDWRYNKDKVIETVVKWYEG